jgi:hypothetical protein
LELRYLEATVGEFAVVPRERSDTGPTGPGCPECGSKNAEMVTGAAADLWEAFGRRLEDPLGLSSPDLRPSYKCRDCRHRFFGEEAGREAEQLDEPCTVVLHREKRFAGALMLMTVHLNGTAIGTVANGASIEFKTSVRFNTIVVVDANGYTRKSMGQTFEAEDGGTAAFRLWKSKLQRV